MGDSSALCYILWMLGLVRLLENADVNFSTVWNLHKSITSSGTKLMEMQFY